MDEYGEVTDTSLDADWQNRVSFLGAGMVPPGVWVTADSFDGNGTASANRALNADSTWAVNLAGEGTYSICIPVILSCQVHATTG